MECPTCGRMLSSERGMRQHHTKVHDESLPNRKCSGCGTAFYDPKARLDYCDDCNPEAGENNGNWKDATETTECDRCGDEFEFYPSNKEGVYCSECVEDATGLLPENPSNQGSSPTVACTHCDSPMEVHESRVAQNERGVFCDLSCYGAWLSENVTGSDHHQWEGGAINYGSGWWTTRREALKRDDYQCQQCGRDRTDIGRNPDVHHIEPVRTFDDPEAAHTLANVVTLCRSCHRDVEAGNIDVPSVVPEK